MATNISAFFLLMSFYIFSKISWRPFATTFGCPSSVRPQCWRRRKSCSASSAASSREPASIGWKTNLNPETEIRWKRKSHLSVIKLVANNSMGLWVEACATETSKEFFFHHKTNRFVLFARRGRTLLGRRTLGTPSERRLPWTSWSRPARHQSSRGTCRSSPNET